MGYILVACCLLIVIIVILYVMSTSFGKGLKSAVINNFHSLYRSSNVIHSLGRSFFDRVASKDLQHLDKVEKMSDRVFRILGLNPGTHTLQGTNTWLIKGMGDSRHILIDTGEDVTSKEYVCYLFDHVFPLTGTKSLDKILLTHGHIDHQGGVVAILNELENRKMFPLPTVHKRKVVGGGQFPEKGFDCLHISDHELFVLSRDTPVDNTASTTTVEAIYTPGHTDDHVVFVVREDNALMSGDCVLGCGTTVFDNLHEYMGSLNKIRTLILDCAMNFNSKPISHSKKRHSSSRNTENNGNLVDYSDSRAMTANNYRIEKIYPGHGPVITNPLEKIEEYIRHREAREKQILRVLQSVTVATTGNNVTNHDQDWISSWELAERVYGSTLPMFVKVSAQHNLNHHLHKLQHENKVRQRWPDMWQATALAFK